MIEYQPTGPFKTELNSFCWFVLFFFLIKNSSCKSSSHFVLVYLHKLFHKHIPHKHIPHMSLRVPLSFLFFTTCGLHTRTLGPELNSTFCKNTRLHPKSKNNIWKHPQSISQTLSFLEGKQCSENAIPVKIQCAQYEGKHLRVEL